MSFDHLPNDQFAVVILFDTAARHLKVIWRLLHELLPRGEHTAAGTDEVVLVIEDLQAMVFIHVRQPLHVLHQVGRARRIVTERAVIEHWMLLGLWQTLRLHSLCLLVCFFALHHPVDGVDLVLIEPQSQDGLFECPGAADGRWLDLSDDGADGVDEIHGRGCMHCELPAGVACFGCSPYSGHGAASHRERLC